MKGYVIKVFLFSFLFASFHSCSSQSRPELLISPVGTWPPSSITYSSGMACSIVPMIGKNKSYVLHYSKDELKYGDTIYAKFPAFIVFEHKITIEDLESMLRKQGFNNLSIRENVYWFCQLPKANVIDLKTQYGDSRGQLLVAEGIQIPSEYYTFNQNGRWSSGHVTLAEIEFADGSFIKYYLYLEGTEVKFVMPNISNVEISTPVYLDPQQYKLEEPYSLRLGIESNSVLNIAWMDKNRDSYLTSFYPASFCYSVHQRFK